MSNQKSAWELLSSIDVSDKIEKKSNLSYLSWAWAWGVLKGHFPNASFVKHHSPTTGMPYFVDHNGFAFVRVTVSLGEGLENATEFLPVLDHRNKAVQNPDSFSVNNSLQRCLTKAIAYLGLGHYIYAGEDLPQDAGSITPQPTPSVPSNNAVGVAGVGSTVVPPSVEAASASKPNGVSISKPDGSSEVADTVGSIASVFTNFIPTCRSEADLARFYKDNSLPLSYVKERSADTHKEVLELFSLRKKDLKDGV